MNRPLPKTLRLPRADATANLKAPGVPLNSVLANPNVVCPEWTNAPTGSVDRNWTESGGKAPQPGVFVSG